MKEQQLLREKFGYTQSELNVLAKKESGNITAYCHKLKEDGTAFYGLWITSEDAMDFVGKFKIKTNNK